MLITNSPLIGPLSLLAGVFAVSFLEEIPAPDLDQEKIPSPLGGGEAWAVPGPPYTDHQVASSGQC